MKRPITKPEKTEAKNVIKISWLAQRLDKVVSYPNKGFPRKQLLPLFLVSTFFTFSSIAETKSLPTQYKTEIVAENLASPWSMVKTPDDIWLITERDGHVVIVEKDKISRAKLDLDELYVAGQGGLLDVVLGPNFTASKEVFFSFSQGKLSSNRLVIAKAELKGSVFTKPKEIYKVKTEKATPQHYAGRMLILPDNTLLFSSGDGFDYREQAQVKTSQLGKLLRINLDGSIPKDNPFSDDQNEKTQAIFSLGHRNPQGLVYDYDNKKIVGHEHGPAGGDELNYLEAGKNYGWPVITYGKDYSRARISPFTEYPSMEQPLVDWTPSIAPSGMAYFGSAYQSFPSLNRHVLITTLVDKKLYSLNLVDNTITQTHVFPEIEGRLRDVFITDEGNVAVLTDGKEAKLILISPL